MQRIVNQALKRYSEDRIAMVDYALESGGVCALSALCRAGPHAGRPSGSAGAAKVLGEWGLRSAQITHNKGKGRSLEKSG